ncbi:hypothetical protein KNSL1_009976 [Colletotrichum chrysophilum]|nr:hypothetical protein KNSL1_009976 [Colletotrichum chrysophilum]
MPRTLICLWGLLAVAQAFPASYQSAIVKRDGKDLLPEYDFIVVGGGTAGLTVADRLSEDPTKTVLVIEYGRIAVDDSFMPPFNTPAAEFLYNLTSVPQPSANNRVFPVPNGAVVGGGSAVNGQIFFRGSKEDHDNWSLLGNPGWDWESVFPYYKKSHSFNPPPQDIQDEYGMTFDLLAYGNTTPIYMSMPGYQYPGQKYEWKAWSERDGIVVQREHGNGNAYGLIWIPSSYDPSRAYNRSFSGLGHYQYVQPRQNYHNADFPSPLKVGTFDDAFRSRMQLALYYPPLDEKGRMTIWTNFIYLLEEEQKELDQATSNEKDMVDIQDLRRMAPVLAKENFNGRQIRNVITTARQLARFTGRRMESKHVQRTMAVAKEFEDYVDKARDDPNILESSL